MEPMSRHQDVSGRYYFPEKRVPGIQIPGELEQIRGRRVMSGLIEAVRIHEMRFRHAQSTRFGVHHPDEICQCAADGVRQRRCGVVAGRDQHSVEQLTDGELLPGPEPH